MRDGAIGGCSIASAGANRSPHVSGGHRICYVVPGRAKSEVSDAVITGMVLVCYRLA